MSVTRVHTANNLSKDVFHRNSRKLLSDTVLSTLVLTANTKPTIILHIDSRLLTLEHRNVLVLTVDPYFVGFFALYSSSKKDENDTY